MKSPDVQFKEFSLTKQKKGLKRPKSELGKTISKKIRSKKFEKKNKKSM